MQRHSENAIARMFGKMDAHDAPRRDENASRGATQS